MRNDRLRTTRRSAFTLTEILVVLGIVALLAAILFPVLARSKRKAKLTSEISQLRQIGAAAALYAETQGGTPLSVLDFRSTDLWSSPLWAGEADPCREGFRNRLMTAMGSQGRLVRHYLDDVVPFKVSFFSLGDIYSGSEYLHIPLERANPGWLVSFDEQDFGNLLDPTVAFGGSFTRLNLDGSVVHRPSQNLGGAMDPLWLFADTTPEQRTKDMAAL